MTEGPQRNEVNLNVSFTRAPPRPRKQHRMRDIFCTSLAIVANERREVNRGWFTSLCASCVRWVATVHTAGPDHPGFQYPGTWRYPSEPFV